MVDKKCSIWWTFCLLTFLASCSQSKKNGIHKSSSIAEVTFQHKVHAKYAHNFSITYRKNYKLLNVFLSGSETDDTLRYALVPRKLLDKVVVKNARIIPVPIHSLVATSTTHLALTQILKANDVIKGFLGPKYVYSKEIKRRIKKGKITTFSGNKLNREKLLDMHPELVMVSGRKSAQNADFQVLKESGIHVLTDEEWLEHSPLGKAEWMKVMAALLNKEKMANKKFNAIAERYHHLAKMTKDLQYKPLVINNLPFKGAWYVSGGQSYFATFLKDAGARYPWAKSEETGGMQKDFEAVYRQGLKADFWINPGAVIAKKDVVAKDQRLKDFKSFKSGKIYNNNKRMRGNGNDFWESGVVHPDIILGDLIRILHPDLLPDHKLYYYQKVR